MSMILPLFNYSRRLYEEVLRSGILLSEYSVLRLKCLNEIPYSVAQHAALGNFESWTEIFVNNSNGVFYSGSKLNISVFKEQYHKQLLGCLLTAELYEWTVFNSINHLNNDSFISWRENDLISNRPLSKLL